eukprot:CFRG2993T1
MKWSSMTLLKLWTALWTKICIWYHAVGVYAVTCFEMYTPKPVLNAVRFIAPDVMWAAHMYIRRSQSVTAKLVDHEKITDAVLNSQAVQAAINFDESITSDRRFSTPSYYSHKKVTREAKARRLLAEMGTKPSMLPIAFAGYLLRKAFRLLYMFGINVDKDEVAQVHRLAKKHPLVFLPTHKSHLDYLIILYVCFVHDLPIPAVVAGNNLNMPFIGSLLRHCGAFFIRRTFAGDADPLYGAIFREYLKQLLIHGHSLEMFIEGGRSRNGKVLMPKTGALQSVIGAVMESQLDVMIIPIALSFDRIVETQSHLNELSGKPKQAEQLFFSLFSISSIMTSAATQANTFGSVDLRFAKPISIRQFIRDSEKKLPSIPNLSMTTTMSSIESQTTVDVDDVENRVIGNGQHTTTPPSSDDDSLNPERDHRSLVTDKWPYLSYEDDHDSDLAKYLAFMLGYRVLYECNDVSVVLPASLLATVLLSQHQRGIFRNELISKVYWLSNEIDRRGGRVAPITTDTIDMTVTLVLGGIGGSNELVKTHNDRLLLSLYNPQERMELSTYRNQLVHHFIREAILCCCVYALEKDNKDGPTYVDHTDLYKMNRYLTQLLKLEFIFRPSTGVGINEHFELTIREMMDRGIIKYFENDPNKICVSEELEDGEMKGTLTYLFLCSIAWPFIDTYWLATLGLFALLPHKAIQEDVLIAKMQEFGETLYFSGAMDLYESISKVTLENAILLLNKWRVICILRVEGAATTKRAIQLRPEYSSTEKVEELVFQIATFRKKSRMYRSRRFRVHHHHEVWDAINTVKELVRKASHHGSASVPPSPSPSKKSLHI